MPINGMPDVQVIKSGVQLRQSDDPAVSIANVYISNIHFRHSTAIKKQVPATFSILNLPVTAVWQSSNFVQLILRLNVAFGYKEIAMSWTTIFIGTAKNYLNLQFTVVWMKELIYGGARREESGTTMGSRFMNVTTKEASITGHYHEQYNELEVLEVNIEVDI
ncbi:hypothetical protein ARMSODRAFT_979584 [Armillaria solidipes]|uniref:Uncharacterized protein n=1 Tax=Armillaria solidipes TaxID=1076256 RepID=A0A2H3BLP8_9AGAR|nr:hypothetical protein ARMSODRAFT_979584 [Armillaria solidipes]